MQYLIKHIKTWLLGTLFCLLFTSCFKDKGNYAYTIPTAVSVDSFGAKAALYLDSILITPTLRAYPDSSILNDKGRFSYLWTAAIVNRVATKGDVPLLELSTEKTLRIKLTMRPEKYILYLKVVDVETGNIYYQQTPLTVSTTTNEGWMLLSDVNNIARLDMVSFLPSPLTDTLVLTDLLKNYGMPELHGPKDISFTLPNQGQVLYITGSDGGHKLDGDVFYWQPSYNLKYECLFDYGAGFSPGYVRNSSSAGSYLLYYGNNYYYQNLVTSSGYGLPVNRVAGETADFDASPLIGKAINSSNPAVLFDRVNKRFLRMNEGASTCAEIPDPDPTKVTVLFSYKPNMDLLYMVTNQANSITYAILKDPATGKVFVYSFSITTGSISQNFAKELTAANIGNAEHFAISPEFGYLFYSVGSKIYEVDFDNPAVSKLAIDLGSKKISLMKFHQFRAYTAAKYATNVKSLLVGSYDTGKPAESCGTLSQYSVPGLFGDPVLIKSWSGFGKIVSLTYRER
jgi:hypothetical protein